MRNFLLIGTFCFMAMFCSANSTSSIQYSQIRKVAVSDLSQLTNTFAIVNEDSTWVELVTPPVADQDTVHNCVGWSMCYANASFSNRPFMVVAIQNGEEVLRQIIPSVH